MRAEILLINVKSASDRLAFQTAQFEQLGLTFKRIEAFDEHTIDSDWYDRIKTSGTRLMTKRESACLASHRAAWDYAAQTGEPCIILEDDAVLSTQFEKVCDAVLQADLPENAVVNLELTGNKKLLGNGQAMYDSVGLYELLFAGAGAGTYLIYPEAARILVDRSATKANLADLFLTSAPGIKHYQVTPAPARQLQFFVDRVDGIEQPAGKTIHPTKSSKPSSWQSFKASPMSRVRKLAFLYNDLKIALLRRRHSNSPMVTEDPELITSLNASMLKLNSASAH